MLVSEQTLSSESTNLSSRPKEFEGALESEDVQPVSDDMMPPNESSGEEEEEEHS